MNLTDNQLRRVIKDWKRYAGGEHVEIQVIKDTTYGYTTELGALRLLKIYRLSEGADMGFSNTKNTFYFRLETE